jgi:hypothetical protein
LNTVHGSTITKSWQSRFDTYLRSIPPYYLPVYFLAYLIGQ